MSESLMGFTLGGLIVVIASLAWKAQGMRAERWQKLRGEIDAVRATAESAYGKLQGYIGYQTNYEERIAQIARKWEEKYEESAAGASDQAIAILSARVGALEKHIAAQDLTILDTAERVAHKLQDRRRKREQGELDSNPDVPLDPAMLLAEARRAYGVTAPAPDPAQLSMNGIGQ